MKDETSLAASFSFSLYIPGYRNQASSAEPTQFSAHNASVIYIDNFYANIGVVH